MIEQPQAITVNQLTKYIRRKFQADPYIYQNDFWVTGELTNYRLSSRHQYFALKDDNEELAPNERYQISAVMFASDFAKVKFDLENGMKVFVRGHVDVYPNRGSYQFYVKQLEVQGQGALQIAFQQMYEKLKKEGLFDQPKKPIRPFPRRVAIVTSNDAAVKHDIITTFRRRNPLIQLVFFPTKVQGDDAAPMIARQIQRVSEDPDYDTLIVARGGGSRGDLWAFNSEEVGRAIAACPIPVISSVGHEVDTTIADLVADDREATPTSAAVKASAWLLTDVQASIADSRQQLYHLTKTIIERYQERLRGLRESYIFQDPTRITNQATLRMDELCQQLGDTMERQQQQRHQQIQLLKTQLAGQSPANRLSSDRQRLRSLKELLIDRSQRRTRQARLELQSIVSQLQALDPGKILARGYSYVTAEAQVVKSVHDVTNNQHVQIHLADGTLEAEIKQINQQEE
ncbi:exodeoxyribonuclease VII large subunit [Limosilactobacillus caecicola]|uniref:exodeoxyribonuclease VII large subunit n=1 Tax=Limosilactobacillus caecicola TaxID=2941332 RepID=UPI00203FB18A|nr:exodeoxyribonuclease VII large subunit [Limosilactobacillus caecicola]